MKNLFILLVFIACARTPTPRPEKTLVFIQGFHLDEKSWDQVVDRIPKDKFNVQTFGRLARETGSLKQIATETCDDLPTHSILVAHSFGGAIANAMFGVCPDKILKIIYISALIPNNNERPFDRVKSKEDQANYSKAVSFADKKMIPKQSNIFYQAMDSEVDMGMKDLPHVYEETMDLGSEKLSFEASEFEKLPKSFIITGKDPVVGLKTQQLFISSAKITEVDTIPTGHFPMISKPQLLSEIILKWANN